MAHTHENPKTKADAHQKQRLTSTTYFDKAVVSCERRVLAAAEDGLLSSPVFGPLSSKLFGTLHATMLAFSEK